MMNLDSASGTDDLVDLSGQGGARGRIRAVLAECLWRAFLAGLIIFLGTVVAALGPILALACGSGAPSGCQDGLRSARFDEVISVVALFVVPAVTVMTVIGLMVPRGGPRVGRIGALTIGALLCVIMVLGQIPA
ncbi:hypothetical protein [Streptomyces luteolus]|uniref:Integral membrane protein n=1 Tax=Streptomyces luteolus TaxID=3043615 RepID=A0ABT6SQV5_9ACTN|nr:hypothetical protein [Streptomyces sp. B-S-A12]MDI3417988.1 hypothetical protein [Streptomyces sp. B-S-A12]